MKVTKKQISNIIGYKFTVIIYKGHASAEQYINSTYAAIQMTLFSNLQ